MHPVHDWRLMWRECSQTVGTPRVWWYVSCLLLKPHSVYMQPSHRNSQGLVRCSLLILVTSCGVNAAKPSEFIGFGEMHPVSDWSLIRCECNHTIGIPRFLRDASCLLLKLYLAWMQPKHRNSLCLARCILFMFETLCSVSSAKTYEFMGFGDMHPVCGWRLMWRECSQTIRIPRVWWDVSCSSLKPHPVYMLPNHRNSQGLVRCSLLIIVTSCGVNAAKP